MSKRTVIAAFMLGAAAGTAFRRIVTSEQVALLRLMARATRAQLEADAVATLCESTDPTVASALQECGLDPTQGFTYERYIEAVPLTTRITLAGKYISALGNDAANAIREEVSNLNKP